jgi:hypothetical protein
LPSKPHKRLPWNKSKLTGAKPPLRPKQVWSIRTNLQVEWRTWDLAMFNLAIDSKLRGCDVIVLKVEDVGPRGYSVANSLLDQLRSKTDVPSGAPSDSFLRGSVTDANSIPPMPAQPV